MRTMGNSASDVLKKDLKQEVSLMNPSMEYKQVSRLQDPLCTPVLSNGKWLQIVKNSDKGSFPLATRLLDSKIPRHLVSLDDKYLRRCLELIHLTALKPSPHSLSLGSAKINHFDSPLNDTQLEFDLPLGDSQKLERSLEGKNGVISQGTLQFTVEANEIPQFVYSLENQTDIYVASLSNVESGLDFTYMIHVQRGGKSGESSSNLVGKIKVSSSFISGSSLNVEREFVLFSNGEPLQLPCHHKRKNSRGLSKKVVEVIKNRRRSNSRLSRTSFTSDSCSWEPLQEPNHDLDQVNNLPANLETLAVVVKQQQELVGGWGMKFLKKSSLDQTNKATETSRDSMSMDVVIPSGIHGGPKGSPLSLIQRWKSDGNCDCGGWDLGCPLTVFKGQPSKHQTKEGQSHLFDLYTKGTKDEMSELRIANVQKGLYLVQFRQKLTVLQSFSIALAYIHCQCLKLRPCQVKECTEA